MGTTSVSSKYCLESPVAGVGACSLYGVRMDVNHKASDKTFKSMQVRFVRFHLHPERSIPV